MAFFSDRGKQDIHPNALAQANLEFLRDSCPSVFEALCGTVDDNGKWIVNPLRLTIYTENGRLMFSICSKLSVEAFFGSVKDPTHLFESIEHSIATGEFKAIPNRFAQGELAY